MTRMLGLSCAIRQIVPRKRLIMRKVLFFMLMIFKYYNPLMNYNLEINLPPS
jgi:hypothetical protein